MKERLLVMNGSRIVQAEEGGAWLNRKVEKAGELKPGIYNIFNATKADSKAQYTGTIVHTDKDSVYQQTTKTEFIVHRTASFDSVPKVGESKTISYGQNGMAKVEGVKENVKLSKAKAL
jgi:hypothetical protein